MVDDVTGIRGDAKGDDRDVEGQVVSGDLTVNTEVIGTDTTNVRGDSDGGEQLNLAEEANVAVGQGGTNSLAHVTENDVGASGGDGGLQTRAGSGHDAVGQLIRIGGGGGNNGGGGVIGRGELNLTDETLNGRHLIFRT